MLNYEFPPMGGGAGNATDNISKNLALAGHNVTVLTSKCGGQPVFEVKNGVKIYRVFSWRNSIHDCGFKGAYTYILFAAFKLWKFNRTEKFDILHYFFSLPTGLLSLFPWAFKNTPYIVSLRGSDVPYYDIYNKKVHLLNLILKPVNTYIWRNAKEVVALSRGLKATAMKTASKQSFKVIPNGVETDLFNPGLCKKKSANKFRLITVSRLINRKGIDHVLAALAALKDKDIELLIVGIGNYENTLKKMCSELKLNDCVTFYGYCLREQLFKLYNKADVFILPSLAESFGLVFTEAMACGLPVIGGRTGGVPDLIKSENGILVEPGNIKEIKSAIVKMKQGQKMRVCMGEANRLRVLEHYSWGSVAQKYYQIYQEEQEM
ncbi:MAG: glycosyltransferase family 4 protein [Deltaproteobacteria bacterium]|jgi:glycosyltransferase involved in cell wall biosynthesis|nr:glycosyltransferase family 4 protein [Deltaproteobacteria bacterium]